MVKQLDWGKRREGRARLGSDTQNPQGGAQRPSFFVAGARRGGRWPSGRYPGDYPESAIIVLNH